MECFPKFKKKKALMHKLKLLKQIYQEVVFDRRSPLQKNFLKITLNRQVS